MDTHARLAERLRTLRTQQGWSLDALASRSGVSRSNISLIERGESSPSAVVLDRLATALGVTLAELFAATPAPEAHPEPLLRAADQAVWRDPASGYLRRKLSPDSGSPLQLVAVEFPAGQRVAYETGARVQQVEQQIWVLAGTIEVSLDHAIWRLEAGDCLAMRLDGAVVFHNPGTSSARYLVALVKLGAAGERRTA